MIDTFLHRWLRVPYALHHVVVRPASGKPRGTVLLIHGIGNSSAAWDEVVSRLPEDTMYVTIDLLGFGDSPRPDWAIYSAKTQARSVLATLIKLRLRGRVTLVGHSLGALVGVEVAKRYPMLVDSLILCSPPFYSENRVRRLFLPHSDRLLRRLYRLIRDHPDQFLKASRMAKKYGLVHKAYNVTNDDLASYMSALEASILNQTSLSDAKRLKKPMTIIYGSLDPVVIKRNLKEVVVANPRATLKTIVAGHEVRRGVYINTVIQAVREAIEGKK